MNSTLTSVTCVLEEIQFYCVSSIKQFDKIRRLFNQNLWEKEHNISNLILFQVKLTGFDIVVKSRNAILFRELFKYNWINR